MRVLIAYASRHGATQGIAERVAGTLTTAGLDAEIRSLKDAGDLAGYDAFVIGSAVYMFHWLKEMPRFLRRHEKLLSEHPVWLFSSGPLGTETTDAKGRDVLEVSAAKEAAETRGVRSSARPADVLRCVLPRQAGRPCGALRGPHARCARRHAGGRFPGLGSDRRVGGRHRCGAQGPGYFTLKVNHLVLAAVFVAVLASVAFMR